MKTTTKACLFGGALFTAGLTAQAQNFIYSANSVYSGTYGTYPSFNYAIAYGGAGDYQLGQSAAYDFAYNYYTGGLAASAYSGANMMRMEATWDGGGVLGYGYGGGRVQQFFTVDVNSIMTIEWDVTGTDGFNFALYGDDTAGGLTNVLAFDGSVDPLAGSVDVNLVAGQTYSIVLALDAGFFPYYYTTATQYIQATLAVPAPGGIAALGLGGLLAARRRR